MIKKIISYVFLFMSVFVLHAEEIEMADTMRSEGKIYVVVAVLSIIFAGIVVFLVSLERKVSKLEKQLDK